MAYVFDSHQLLSRRARAWKMVVSIFTAGGYQVVARRLSVLDRLSNITVVTRYILRF